MYVKVITVNGSFVFENVLDIDNNFLNGFVRFVIEEENDEFEIRQEIIKESEIISITILSEDY